MFPGLFGTNELKGFWHVIANWSASFLLVPFLDLNIYPGGCGGCGGGAWDGGLAFCASALGWVKFRFLLWVNLVVSALCAHATMYSDSALCALATIFTGNAHSAPLQLAFDNCALLLRFWVVFDYLALCAYVTDTYLLRYFWCKSYLDCAKALGGLLFLSISLL